MIRDNLAASHPEKLAEMKELRHRLHNQGWGNVGYNWHHR